MGPRAAMIGSSDIADAHIAALAAAGFDVVLACSRAGSARLGPLCERHGIEAVVDGFDALVARRADWDAAVLATPVEHTAATLEHLLDLGVPVLVEKPVGTSSTQLVGLVSHENASSVLVGYNRRFYSTVARLHAEAMARGPGMLQVTVPEALDVDGGTRNVPTNSVHALDLIRFVVGPLEITSVARLGSGRPGIGALLSSARGDIVQLSIPFAASANWSVVADWGSLRVELGPIERLIVQEGMSISEPTSEVPLRTYSPTVRSVEVAEVEPGQKPGFLEQARAFHRLVEGGSAQPGATLADALAALELAEAIVG